MAGSASRSTEQVKEQEKQTQCEAARLTPCCIPGKSGEECPVLGEGYCVCLRSGVSGLAMGHGTKASAPSSHRPLAYPGGQVPPACTRVAALMALLKDEGNLTNTRRGQGVAGFRVLQQQQGRLVAGSGR